MKNQTSIVHFENSRNGLISVGYALDGNQFSGYYIARYLGGKLIGFQGTTSSKGKKPFMRMPKQFIVNN